MAIGPDLQVDLNRRWQGWLFRIKSNRQWVFDEEIRFQIKISDLSIGKENPPLIGGKIKPSLIFRETKPFKRTPGHSPPQFIQTIETKALRQLEAYFCAPAQSANLHHKG